MTAPGAPSVRCITRRASGLVVAGLTVPVWVRLWCDRSLRSVAAHPADAVAAASAAGDSVLIPRTNPPAARRPRIAVALRELPDDAFVLDDALDAATHLHGRLTWAAWRAAVVRRTHRTAVDVRLIRAWPHEIVGELLDADLLVVGGLRTGSIGRVGLVAASAIGYAPCAVLLTPRPAMPWPGPPPESVVSG
jgi:nucleotide-binding universal stress UspA family protein